jgi:hypothetical protein
MEYSEMVRKTASDLVLKFANHLSGVSLGSLKGEVSQQVKDKGEFPFDLSEFTKKEIFQVLSLAKETLKFSYTFKVKGKNSKVVYYKRNIGGIPLTLFNSAFIAGCLLAGFLVLTCLYLLLRWFVF